MKSNHLKTNVHELERVASLIGGAFLLVPVFRRPSLLRLVGAAAGLVFVKRGVTGHCELYHALGFATEKHPSNQAIEFSRSVTISKPVEEVFAAWRAFELFPGFMKYVDEVDQQGRRASHWKVHTRLGPTIEWDAISRVNDLNHTIAWKTTDTTLIQHSGNIKFAQAPQGLGTEVTVYCRYTPLGGRVVGKLAQLLRISPEGLINEDLCRFKQILEEGELAGANTPAQSNGNHSLQP